MAEGKKENEAGFHTMKGYDMIGRDNISSAMEDYLEMICRCAQKPGYVRINTLASRLNVTPPSSSKMAAKLKEQGFIEFERYGIITPTPRGWEMGAYLLRRHELLQDFFCRINGTDDELKLVEQIEHFIDPRTVENIERLLKKGF